mgnify:CR=1 FL=1
MAKVTELVAVLAAPIAEQNGCTLWDVEYVREAGQWFLRVYIDKPEGISINGLRGGEPSPVRRRWTRPTPLREAMCWRCPPPAQTAP